MLVGLQDAQYIQQLLKTVQPEGEKNHKKGGLNCVFGNFFFYDFR